MEKFRIMVVEDFDVHRNLIRGVLNKIDDVEALFVVNPVDDRIAHIKLKWVIDKFEACKPDILILDMAWNSDDMDHFQEIFNAKDVTQYWNMKKKEGLEPQVIKFLSYLENKPVFTIILTGYSKQVDVVLKQVIHHRADRTVLEKPDQTSANAYQELLAPVLSQYINARRFIRDGQMEIASDSSLNIQTLNTAMEVARTNAPILITGETGIGKSYLARAIHAVSHRNKGPFVNRNIASIPHELFYSTLFGHDKGAFTGAIKSKPGIFEKAHTGTIFLDEIGDLPEAEQVHLLKAIEEGEVYPLGGEDADPVKTDVRYIVATNKDVEQLVRSGKFRRDLYFRLNVIQIRLAPLRERRGDIALLVDFFMNKYSRELQRSKRMISPGEMDEVMEFDFPGNIRQLGSIVYRSILLNKTIPEAIADEGEVFERTKDDMDELIQAAWQRISLGNQELKQVLSEIEARLVQKADGYANSNDSAARLLGVSLSTYENKKRQAKNYT